MKKKKTMRKLEKMEGLIERRVRMTGGGYANDARHDI